MAGFTASGLLYLSFIFHECSVVKRPVKFLIKNPGRTISPADNSVHRVQDGIIDRFVRVSLMPGAVIVVKPIHLKLRHAIALETARQPVKSDSWLLLCQSNLDSLLGCG